MDTANAVPVQTELLAAVVVPAVPEVVVVVAAAAVPVVVVIAAAVEASVGLLQDSNAVAFEESGQCLQQQRQPSAGSELGLHALQEEHLPSLKHPHWQIAEGQVQEQQQQQCSWL